MQFEQVRIRCDVCGAEYYTTRCNHCYMDVGAIEGEENAVKAWNRRAR